MTEHVRAGEVDDDLVREWNQMRNLVNGLKTNFNALLVQLDADAGVTDTDYEETHEVTSPDVDGFYLGY